MPRQCWYNSLEIKTHPELRRFLINTIGARQTQVEPTITAEFCEKVIAQAPKPVAGLEDQVAQNENALRQIAC